MADKPSSPENPQVAHEQGDVNVKAILWFAAGFVAFGVVLHFGLAWMYFSFRSAEEREKGSAYPKDFTEGTSRLPKTPRLEGIEGGKEEASGERTGNEVTVSREEELSRYGWVDEEKGIVSIPIERAFERFLSQKPKVRRQEGPPWRDRGDTMPHHANSGRGTKEKER